MSACRAHDREQVRSMQLQEASAVDVNTGVTRPSRTRAGMRRSVAGGTVGLGAEGREWCA